MSPQPPRSPLTATLFPSTTLFRSLAVPVAAARAAGVSAALAAVLVGGPSRRTVVIRRRRADHRDRLLGEPLDVPQVAALVAVAERDRHAAGAGTRGAAEDRTRTSLKSRHSCEARMPHSHCKTTTTKTHTVS